ncbi:MAG TPA: membrane protein insertion efficiency factor YidD [Gammaproteobacteria bacterium]|nr:membrane protein insertion efficiency factor YidD [Gammaproteobacteria bacterium]
MEQVNRKVQRFAVRFIHLYRLTVGSILGPSCRYTPSCSHYAEQAVQEHGLIKGGKLALKRISRCHPWHEGGYDPVPERRD